MEGRLGTADALAGTWRILLLVTNPPGEHGLLDMLKGELIVTSNADLAWTALSFGLVPTPPLVSESNFCWPPSIASWRIRSKRTWYLGRTVVPADWAGDLDGGPERPSARRVWVATDSNVDCPTSSPGPCGNLPGSPLPSAAPQRHWPTSRRQRTRPIQVRAGSR